MTAPNASTVTSPSTQISWHGPSRVAFVRYTSGAILKSKDGTFLVDTLSGWVGGDRETFAVLADAAGLGGTDTEYRAKASRFFREHRARAFIALINLGPVIYVVVEMFRVATGVPLKAFGDEASARSWLRTNGIGA
jgi:hypothetical protein